MKDSQSHATSQIKHHRNMVTLMVLSPLVVMTLILVALISGNSQNRATEAAVNSAPTTRFQPVNGKVYSGVRAPYDGGKYDSFLSLTGQSSTAIYHSFRKYPENFNYSWTLTNQAKGAVAMVSWTLFSGGGYCSDAGKNKTGGNCTPNAASNNKSIANGKIDQYIIDRANEVRSYGKPVFLRLNWEMNGTWFGFSSYKSSSCATGSGCVLADNSVEQYRDVWRRVAIIMDGGTKAEINARLTAQGMPGLAVSNAELPAVSNVALVWNASQGGLSDPIQYWPGDEFVDWSGIDWYSKGNEDPGNPQAANTAFINQQKNPNLVYDSFSGPNSPGKKPFMLGEWGMWGALNSTKTALQNSNMDNYAWMSNMFDWIEARPQVKAQVYFNNDSSGVHELRWFPQSANVFKNRIASSRYIKSGSLVTSVSPNPTPPTPTPPAPTPPTPTPPTPTPPAPTPPTPTPKPLPVTPVKPPPPIIIPDANSSTPVNIPSELVKQDDGTYIGDFTGDGLNEIVIDSNNDGKIDPVTEVVLTTEENPNLTDLTKEPITTSQYRALALNQSLDDEGIVSFQIASMNEVKIPKPVAYTFLAVGTVSLAGIGSYLAITKLTIFAGIRGRWGL